MTEIGMTQQMLKCPKTNKLKPDKIQYPFCAFVL